MFLLLHPLALTQPFQATQTWDIILNLSWHGASKLTAVFFFGALQLVATALTNLGHLVQSQTLVLELKVQCKHGTGLATRTSSRTRPYNGKLRQTTSLTFSSMNLSTRMAELPAAHGQTTSLISGMLGK